MEGSFSFLSFKYFVRHFLGRSVYFSGIYENWDDASKNSSGYDQRYIFDKVLAAAIEAKEGRASFERDGMNFFHPERPDCIIDAICDSCQNGRSVSVLDFGGGAGSLFFQSKPWLSDCLECDWRVVEQQRLADLGNRFLKEKGLEFFSSIESAAALGQVDIVILSSVLQYVEHPYEILKKCFALNPKIVVIDRTPFIKRRKDIITIQRVPKYIVASDYPARLFGNSALYTSIPPGYTVRQRYPALDGVLFLGLRAVHFLGIIIERRL